MITKIGQKFVREFKIRVQLEKSLCLEAKHPRGLPRLTNINQS